MESVNVFPSVGIGKKRVLRAQQKEDYRMRVRERVPTSSSAKPRPIRWKTIVDGARTGWTVAARGRRCLSVAAAGYDSPLTPPRVVLCATAAHYQSTKIVTNNV